MQNEESLDLRNLDRHLEEALDIIRGYMKGIREDPVIPTVTRGELLAKLGDGLPFEETDIGALFEEIRHTVAPSCSKIGHPRFLAWIVTGPSPAGTIGELLNVGLNQVPLSFKGGPVATVMEEIVIHWFGRLFGYGSTSGGILVSGGTMANLTALAAAREARFPSAMRRGIQRLSHPLVMYVSDQGHMSVERSAGMLGIGSDFVRRVETDECYRMRVDSLQRLIDGDESNGFQPFCVVAQAGAVNTGSIDPIPQIAEVCESRGLWLHVDASYGGAAILTGEGHSLLGGISRADSIATDPHKWFFIPVEAGCVLVKNRAHLFDAFKCKAGYLGEETSSDFMNYGFQLTRASRALKIWFGLKAYGLKKISRIVERNITLARDFKRMLEEKPGWEVCAPVELSIVCFRYVPEPRPDETKLNSLQYEILSTLETSGQAFLTPAILDRRVCLRVCFANHRTDSTDVSLLIDLLTSIAERISSTVHPR